MLPASLGGLGLDSAWTRRSAPRAARAPDRRAARLLRRLRHDRRPRQVAAPGIRLRRAALAGARPPPRHAAGRARRAGLRRVLAEPRPGRQSRARRSPVDDRRPRAREARRRRRPALAVRAAALHGRGVRRDRAVPVLHGPRRRDAQHAPCARAARASSPRSRARASCSTRTTPRPSRARGSTGACARAGRTRGCSSSTASCSACAARAAPLARLALRDASVTVVGEDVILLRRRARRRGGARGLPPRLRAERAGAAAGRRMAHAASTRPIRASTARACACAGPDGLSLAPCSFVLLERSSP